MCAVTGQTGKLREESSVTVTQILVLSKGCHLVLHFFYERYKGEKMTCNFNYQIFSHNKETRELKWKTPNIFLLVNVSWGMWHIVISICWTKIKWAGLNWDRQRRRISPFQKLHPCVTDSLMCVMEVLCVSIYRVPAQRGSVIIGCSCRLARPQTVCGVKEEECREEIWTSLSFRAAQSRGSLCSIYLTSRNYCVYLNIKTDFKKSVVAQTLCKGT